MMDFALYFSIIISENLLGNASSELLLPVGKSFLFQRLPAGISTGVNSGSPCPNAPRLDFLSALRNTGLKTMLRISTPCLQVSVRLYMMKNINTLLLLFGFHPPAVASVLPADKVKASCFFFLLRLFISF